MKTQLGQLLVDQVLTLEIGEEIFIDEDFINEVHSSLSSRALGGRRFKAEITPDGVGYDLRRLAEEKKAVEVEIA
jgi:hypothetical protein